MIADTEVKLAFVEETLRTIGVRKMVIERQDDGFTATVRPWELGHGTFAVRYSETAGFGYSFIRNGSPTRICQSDIIHFAESALIQLSAEVQLTQAIDDAALSTAYVPSVSKPCLYTNKGTAVQFTFDGMSTTVTCSVLGSTVEADLPVLFDGKELAIVDFLLGLDELRVQREIERLMDGYFYGTVNQALAGRLHLEQIDTNLKRVTFRIKSDGGDTLVFAHTEDGPVEVRRISGNTTTVEFFDLVSVWENYVCTLIEETSPLNA